MGQYQGPLLGLVVPPHVRVSRLTLERQHRVTLVRAEFVSAVGAVSEALDLAGRRGGIKCHDRILAEARAIGHIHRRATTEDRAQSVGQQGRLVMLPVDQVAAGGVSPRHVLPFGAKGVPLVAKVPDAIFIDHTVGVVHPAIERCVVISGAILLPIVCIKCIANADVFPASILFRLTHGGSSLRRDHVQHDMLALIGGEIEGYIMIDFLRGETYDDAALHLAIGQHMDGGLLACVLHRQEQILTLLRHSDERIIGAEMLNAYSFGFLCG